MAKKSFSAGVTKTGVLDNVIFNILQRKKYNPIQKTKNTRRMELNPLWKAFW